MKELPKAYNPAEHEERIYKMWEGSGAFNPDTGLANSLTRNQKSFCVIMPPPNANGALHIGHAVGMTLEDIMVRYHRMAGDATLWLPGADHAGFETQVVFERKLEKEGKSRFQFGREELYKMMWEFTQANRSTMENQTRKLGASCDWTRKKFTLDPDIVETVYATFKQLYDDGLAYRDVGIVNWCPKHQTSLSDLEIKYVEQTDPLYYIKYGPLTLATVRPETKFGDTALAVHPGDKRYKKYTGKTLEIEDVFGTSTISVIADKAVDPTFGTGVIKVTPAHDPLDFEIGRRHKLDVRQVIGFDGKLNETAGRFAGLKVKPVREAVVEALKEKGLIEKIDSTYKHNVAVCYKCGNVIEPLPLTQWFVAMKKKTRGKSLQQLGLDAVKRKNVVFVTKHFEKIYNHWLATIRDWNVSRQIAWGIPINAWYCANGHIHVGVPKTVQVIAIRHGEATHNVDHTLSGDPSRPDELTAKGREQAKQLARQLKDENIDALYASQFLRTQNTANEILSGRKLRLRIDKRLNDIDSGGLEGMLVAKAKTLTKDWTMSAKGSETLDDIKKRVLDFLTDFAAKHHRQTVAIVSSEIVLHLLEQLLEGREPDEGRVEHPDVGTYKKFNVSAPIVCKQCGDLLRRDPDVFDTWFSSGQWPFATLQSTGDFKTFYPTSVMETGHDILFFWVARMVMLGMYATGKPPFKHVYLHGLVRDKDRQKMSKSKGNVIDPLGVASQYGTDAVRMALVYGNAPGSDIVISEEKIRGMRNFANKVWNIARFILMNRDLKSQNSKLKTVDQEILKSLRKTVRRVTTEIDEFRFHEAAETVYQFIWHEFADNYIEQAKQSRNEQVLLDVLTTSLKLLHPFMPFLSEAIWQQLCERKLTSGMLITAPWPTKNS